MSYPYPNPDPFPARGVKYPEEADTTNFGEDPAEAMQKRIAFYRTQAQRGKHRYAAEILLQAAGVVHDIYDGPVAADIEDYLRDFAQELLKEQS